METRSSAAARRKMKRATGALLGAATLLFLFEVFHTGRHDLGERPRQEVRHRSGSFVSSVRPRLDWHSPDRRVALSGLVIDDQGHQVEGAQVALEGHQATARTDARGSFALDAPRSGRYVVYANGRSLVSNRLDVWIDDDTAPVTLVLRHAQTVVVRVVDDETNAPISGAKVLGRTTSSDGTVRLDGLPIGGNITEVDADGYSPRLVTLFVEDNANQVPLLVRLFRGVSVEGYVTDSGGGRVANAIIEAEDPDGEVVDTTSNTVGMWQFAGLAAGRTYSFSARRERGCDSADVEKAVPPGSDLKLTVEECAEVHGTVFTIDGMPASGIEVFLENERRQYSTKTLHDGTFIFRTVPPGTFKLHAATAIASSQLVTILVSRASSIESRLQLEETQIGGEVIGLDGVPVDNARLAIISNDEQIMSSEHTAISDSTGHFLFDHVIPGQYLLFSSRSDAKFMQPDSSMTVTSGNRHVLVTLPGVGEIRGRVILHGRPVLYFGVTVIDRSDLRFVRATPVRDYGGLFDVKGVPAGTWNVILSGPGFARKMVYGVVVASGGVADIGDAIVDDGQSIYGIVRDRSGQPVGGALVSVNQGVVPIDPSRLSQLACGIVSSVSDDHGVYNIVGIAAPTDDRRNQLTVTMHGDTTLTRILDPNESRVDITIQ